MVSFLYRLLVYIVLLLGLNLHEIVGSLSYTKRNFMMKCTIAPWMLFSFTVFGDCGCKWYSSLTAAEEKIEVPAFSIGIISQIIPRSTAFAAVLTDHVVKDSNLLFFKHDDQWCQSLREYDIHTCALSVIMVLWISLGILWGCNSKSQTRVYSKMWSKTWIVEQKYTQTHRNSVAPGN